MKRFIGLAESVKSREPSVNEALELLLCIATGQYGVEPDQARATLNPGSRIDPSLTELPAASAYLLAACEADAERIVGLDHVGLDHGGLDHGGLDHGGLDHGGLDHGVAPPPLSTGHGGTEAENPQHSHRPAVSVSTSRQPDFRQARWGMSRREVLAAERLNLSNGPDQTLFAFDTVIGRRVAAVYQFIDDRLARAGYYPTDSKADPDSCVAYTNLLVSEMTEQYGPPTVDHEWRNELLRHIPAKYALALCGGDLIIRNRWQTDRTHILQVTRGVNYKIRVAAIYIAKKESLPNAEGDFPEIPEPEFV